MFGPLVFSCDPANVFALDPEAACCFDFEGSRLVLALGLGWASRGNGAALLLPGLRCAHIDRPALFEAPEHLVEVILQVLEEVALA